jgi:hypothetical protein
VLPLPAIEAGLKLQVLSEGNPAHDEAPNWMVPGKPFRAVMVNIKSADAPGLVTVTVLMLVVRVKSTFADEEVDAT